VGRLSDARARLLDEATATPAGSASLAGTLHWGIPYPLPTANSMPAQEPAPERPPVP
jgi:phospholipase C